MNLYALAEQDLAMTIEDPELCGRGIILADKDGNETALTGIVGDIGYLLDTEGNPIAGRSIVASFRMSSFTKDGNYVIPCEGWKLKYNDMANHEWTLFVNRAEPDRTLGICRLILSLDFDSEGGS